MNAYHLQPWNLLSNHPFAANHSDSERSAAPRYWQPAVDAQELDDSYRLVVDVPGIDPESIEITCENRVLTIKGERAATETSKTDGFSRLERVTGPMLRRFTLPESVDTDGITAQSENGVLTVGIPKATAQQARRIKVAA